MEVADLERKWQLCLYLINLDCINKERAALSNETTLNIQCYLFAAVRYVHQITKMPFESTKSGCAADPYRKNVHLSPDTEGLTGSMLKVYIGFALVDQT